MYRCRASCLFSCSCFFLLTFQITCLLFVLVCAVILGCKFAVVFVVLFIVAVLMTRCLGCCLALRSGFSCCALARCRMLFALSALVLCLWCVFSAHCRIYFRVTCLDRVRCSVSCSFGCHLMCRVYGRVCLSCRFSCWSSFRDLRLLLCSLFFVAFVLIFASVWIRFLCVMRVCVCVCVCMCVCVCFRALYPLSCSCSLLPSCCGLLSFARSLDVLCLELRIRFSYLPPVSLSLSFTMFCLLPCGFRVCCHPRAAIRIHYIYERSD